MNIYYVYQYIREDGTPYYIGKGKDKRAWQSHMRSNGAEIRPTDPSRIQILKEGLSEKDAFLLEETLIAEYGFKAAGGILINMTTGGEGSSPTKEVREAISKKLTGIKRAPRTQTHKENLSAALKGVPKPRSDKHQQNWTEASKRNWATNEKRKESVSAMGKANKGRKHTPEALEKKRLAMLEYWKKKKALCS